MDDFFLISLLVLLVSGRCMPASRSAFRIHILVYLSDAISLQLYVLDRYCADRIDYRRQSAWHIMGTSLQGTNISVV